ncbi:MAG TPA: hypothetical protein DDX07_01880 [Porphyromonadaceae bacterium]|nr:hypothetical protein [Porphyromonadaceae bacterium]
MAPPKKTLEYLISSVFLFYLPINSADNEGSGINGAHFPALHYTFSFTRSYNTPNIQDVTSTQIKRKYGLKKETSELW